MYLGAALALAAVLAFAASAHGVPMFLPLEPPVGPAYPIRAWALSADGAVVVGGTLSASGAEAFRWTSEAGMLGLGGLAGGASSVAFGVSSDGEVVVGSGSSEVDVGAPRPMSRNEAFRWTSEQGMVGLGDLGGGSFESVARGASADGSVIVGYSASPTGLEAFRWAETTGMVGLGDLAGWSFSSAAFGVSADGSVVVGRSVQQGGSLEAFRWTPTGGMVGLGDLPGGRFESSAYGVSADGSVVVGEGASASGAEAFRWTSEGGMVGLGELTGGDFRSAAHGVSADGLVVVGESVSTSAEAFVWDSAHGMRSVRAQLVALGVDMTGWTLSDATAVANDGLGRDNSITIVGYGVDASGLPRAWLARVPEPSTGWLFGTALIGLGALRRRIAVSEPDAARTSGGRSWRAIGARRAAGRRA
jgi:probable HAF family extracellular repeat protein